MRIDNRWNYQWMTKSDTVKNVNANVYVNENQ